MPWPSLVPPTPGTVITAAWESAMVNDPLLWLRLMTGNADPPGNDYVVISQGTSSTAWGKVTANVLAAGAAQGNIGYPLVNRNGDVMQSDLTLSRATASAPTHGALFLGQNGGQIVLWYNGSQIILSGAPFHINNGLTVAGNATLQSGDLTIIRNGAPATGYVYFGNSGSRYLGIDGTQLIANVPSMAVTGDIRTYRASNANTGYLRLGAGDAYVGYDATYIVLNGSTYTVGSAIVAGSITASTTLAANVANGTPPLAVVSQTRVSNLNADMLDGAHAGNANGNVALANGSVVANLNASLLEGHPAADFAAAGHAHGTSGNVPLGFIGLWDTGTPPSGFTIYAATAGRFVAGVGGAFALGGTGGASTHNHAGPSHQHSGPDHAHRMDHSHGTSTSSGPSATDGIGNGGGTSAPTPGHTHDVTPSAVGASPTTGGGGTGLTGAAGAGTTGDGSSVPPWIGLHYIQRTS